MFTFTCILHVLKAAFTLNEIHLSDIGWLLNVGH